MQLLLVSANGDSTLLPSVSCYRPYCILVDMITSVPSKNFAVKQLQEVLSSIEMPQQSRIRQRQSATFLLIKGNLDQQSKAVYCINGNDILHDLTLKAFKILEFFHGM